MPTSPVWNSSEKAAALDYPGAEVSTLNLNFKQDKNEQFISDLCFEIGNLINRKTQGEGIRQETKILIFFHAKLRAFDH